MIQLCRGVPGQRKKREVFGELVERRRLMGHMGRGELGKGKAFGMQTKNIENKKKRNS